LVTPNPENKTLLTGKLSNTGGGEEVKQRVVAGLDDQKSSL
jgi:hypothetical protein